LSSPFIHRHEVHPFAAARALLLLLQMSSSLESGGDTTDGKSNNNNKRRGQRGRGRRLPILRTLRNAPVSFVTAFNQFRTRFLAWPKRMKLMFTIQVILVTYLAGLVGQRMYHRYGYDHRPLPPIEVSYSSFLDVLERQQQKKTTGTTENGSLSVPTMNHVRIGEDRISYRLERTTTDGTESRLPIELPNLSGKRLQQLLRQQQQQKARGDETSYISAYTRIVTNAPPGLIEQLRSNGVSFSAAAAASSSTTASIVSVTIRSLMMSFYCWFLYRFYRQMTGKGGKGDTPGKLANRKNIHDLPAATFDDIAGIDAAKYEVMELVDTIRNPNSYALFGARAPTGLLLVGPPGTGYVCFCYVFWRRRRRR
jgi:hypothetical protein